MLMDISLKMFIDEGNEEFVLRNQIIMTTK